MGKNDVVTKEYMKRPEIFADAFNKFLYAGKQVIKPDALQELDVTEVALPYGDENAAVPEQKYRDVLKVMMTDGKYAYCMMGIENQSKIHYAMPVRNGLYDFMQLSKQVTQAGKAYKKSRRNKAHASTDIELSQSEYLSGFRKEDKLLPVITLVIFWGEEEWDASLYLHDMYSVTDEEVSKYIADYKVNLIAPNHMTEEEINEFRTSLREVMLYIKYSKDKNKIRDVAYNDEKFKHLERNAVDVLNVVTNSKLRYDKDEEEIDMCKAMEDLREEGRTQGREEGRTEGEIIGAIIMCKKLKQTIDDTIVAIADQFNLSKDEAEFVVKSHWEM